MDAKAYLSQARQADRRIAALLERRRRCLELAALRAPGQAGGLEELEREIDRRIDGYAALVCEIEAGIDALEDAQYRDVLRYRYLNGWSWQRIADQMHYSRDWLWHVHARALKRLDETRQAG